MSIVLDCPGCHQPLAVPEEHLDSLVRCPRCGDTFMGRPFAEEQQQAAAVANKLAAEGEEEEDEERPKKRRRRKRRIRGRFDPFTFAVTLEEPVTGQKLTFVA